MSITSFLILLVMISHSGFVQTNNSHIGKIDALQKNPTESTQQNQAPTEKEAKNVQIGISFVGDVMGHKPQIEGAKTQNGYDFRNYFKYVESYINQSDLSICNLETTFAGPPYSGYPLFSTPDQLSQNLKDVGFDIANTINNHTLDNGLSGIKRTIKVAEKAGLKVVGTQKKAEDKDYLITEVKGVKIGIVSATYESKMAGKRTLNGNPINEENKDFINSFPLNDKNADIDIFKQSIKDAKNDGAEIIVAYAHWGEEYDTTPNKREKRIAKKLAESGADIIFASHPHVVQKYDTISLNNGSKEVPVFYSMGNFISNQRTENIKDRNVEQGIIAQARITYDVNNKTIGTIETGYIPTWVDKYYDDSSSEYAVVPLIGDYENNPTLNESNHVKNAQNALSDIKKRMGNSIKMSLFDVSLPSDGSQGQ